MKKIVLLLISLLLPLMTSAQLETIDGIRYYFSKLNDCYQVQNSPTGYSGEIVIPSILNGKRVQEIDNKAFCNNQNVISVHLAYTINKISDEAFYGCSGITSIEIPQNVELIGDKAFANCKNLKDIYCFAKNPSMGIDVFDKTKGFVLHVPAENIPYYVDSKQWKNAKKVVAITTESWAAEQYKKELAEQERLEAEARQKHIQDSIAAREKQIKELNEAKQKLDSDLAAAEKGDAAAMVRLGIAYEEGKGVEKNIHKAIEYYQKAADLGNVEGQFNLGRCYYNGTGLKKDPDAAMIWIEKAIAQGHERAEIYKELFEDEYGSFYKGDSNWRIRTSTGVTFKPGRTESKVKTDHFEVYMVAGLNKDYYNRLVKGEELFGMVGNMFGYSGADYSIGVLDVDSYKSLSKQDKLKLIERELSYFEFFDGGLCMCDPKTDNILEVFYKGNFYPSIDNYRSAKEAAQAKARKAKMAPWVKRFGFDPDGISRGALIKSGRSFKLLSEWYNYLGANGGEHAEFNLSIDRGTSKCYDILWGGYSGRKIGYIWVNGDKITTVVWY